MLSKYALTVLLSLLLSACASPPGSQGSGSLPAWTKQPTRTVDSGYIVYIGSGQDPAFERSQFKAQGQAMQDVANECSFVPKGARVEDRFDQEVNGRHYSWTKVALTFEECEAAKKAEDPDAIRKLANSQMAQEIKSYQGLVASEAGQPGSPSSGEPLAFVEYHPEEGGTVTAPPPRPPITDETTFFVTRQQIVYAKQEVILAAPQRYAVGTPEYARFVAELSPVAMRVREYEAGNPQLRNASNGWSTFPNRPARIPPLSSPVGAPLTAHHGMPPSPRMQATPGGNGASRPGVRPPGRKPRRKRRRR